MPVLRRIGRACTIALCSIVYLALSIPAAAQIGGTGSIQGVVTDQTGSVIPAATVTVTNVATGVKTVRQTTEAGVYTVAPLQPGTYTVAVTAAGFQTLVQENIRVDALSTVAVNVTMTVGETASQITVSDTPPPVATEDVRMGQTMRQELYTALPLAMGNAPRDPTAFVQLMPGVTGGGGTNSAGNVLGGQPNSQEMYVEGLALTNPAVQGETRNVSLGISVEAVDQFQLETAGASVQFGGQGSTNFVVKSGTNQFHGAFYEYFRNDKLDSRPFFATAKNPQKQNEFGVSIGGPIVKNRAFFFSNYDGYRYRTASPAAFTTVPTEAMRRGDFSELLSLPTPVQIFDPATTQTVNGIRTRQPFPGNIIPSDRLSSISRNLQQFLPTPTNPGLQVNLLSSLPFGYNNDNTTNKVDLNLSDRHSFYALFSWGHRGQATAYRGGGNNLPLPYAETRFVDEYTTAGQVRHSMVIGPTAVNQISFGVARMNIPITNATIEGQYARNAGLTGLPPGEALDAFPEISFAGPNAPTNWRGTNARAFIDVTNTYSLQDNVQWTAGKHSLTFGGQLQFSQINVKERAYGSVAAWAFSNNQTAGFNSSGTLLAATGHAYASFLLGAVNSASATEDAVVGTGGRYRTYSWWVQDTFKLLPKLTVILGLRHDIMTPYVEVADRVSFFGPNVPNPAVGGFPGALVFAGDGPNSCNCRTPVSTYYKNFQPRVGLAYSLTDNAVLRAGYSVTSTHRGAVGGRGGGRTGTGLLGYSASPSFTSLDTFSPAFDWDDRGMPAYQSAPFFEPTLNTGFYQGGPQGGTVTYGDPAIGGHPPRYQNWSFGIQHAVASSLTLGVNYVASNGHYLQGGPRGIWSNQVHPRYLALGNILTMQATPANIERAQTAFPEIRLPYSNFSGTIAQMLRPFPQYGGISDPYGMVGNSNYNSVQITADKRMSNGLSFNVNYTFGKAFDDLGFRSGYAGEKAQTVDPMHIFNAIFLYQLPFGKGRRFGSDNGIVSAVLGGWQLSGITTYRSGTGLGIIGAACNVPFAGTCYADFNPSFTGEARINGDYRVTDRSGRDQTTFLDRNAFMNPAAFTYGSTPRTLVYNLRNPSSYNQNLSLRREFPIHESWRFALQLDSFNVFNWVNWGSVNTTWTNANFGRITSQSNSPRVFQLNARLMF